MINYLALILIVAGVVTLLFKWLKQPLVLGYIMAGFLVSPHMPYMSAVTRTESIQTWADIGVMFLLFALGLEFSFKKILRMGVAPIIAVLTIIFFMMSLGNIVGRAFGWGAMDCVFLGGMLCMSSTTIIYKAFDDLKLRQQSFADLVMSVLILEDVLAIVMMVMLSAVASGGNPNGGEMVWSILKIVFFLVLWFVVGLFFIPWFLRSTRRLMTEETLVVLSLGLCCAMAVLSTKTGFSSAFGAFVMGSILAETVEAEKIIRVVEPVKNLFGAIFFVSVGMLVDMNIIVEYAVPITGLVLAILVGQSLFGSLGFLLSGQTLKTAMRCGFSMAQIGEFSFIIASLGLSLGVISNFLYPVVVAVSVVTTFLTPYMIRAAVPVHDLLERRLPKVWIRRLNRFGETQDDSPSAENCWHVLLRQLLVNCIIFIILSIAGIVLMFTFVLPMCRHLMPETWANLLCCVLTIMVISPFLRSIIMKKNHSEEFKALWLQNRMNRFPLAFTVIVRVAIALCFVFYIVQRLMHFTGAVVLCVALALVVLMVVSRSLKRNSIRMERMFLQNLRSREIAEQVRGGRRPLYADRLLDRSIHISEVGLPQETTWAGKTLRELNLGKRFGVHVSRIIRGYSRINIPGRDTMVFPGDKLFVIGNDQQLSNFSEAVRTEILPEDLEVEKHAMRLHQLTLAKGNPLVGKSLAESGLRENYSVMLVGMEQADGNLAHVAARYVFREGDTLWVVGELGSLKKLLSNI